MKSIISFVIGIVFASISFLAAKREWKLVCKGE